MGALTLDPDEDDGWMDGWMDCTLFILHFEHHVSIGTLFIHLHAFRAAL